jgi:adenylylsulfate kinase-like enzyme
MLDAGLLVLAALVSPYRRDREFVRSKIGKERFIEIYIDTPLSICEQRDPKGLYQRARRGEIGDFTGIHSYYEEPLNPDIRVSWQCGYPEAACFEIVELLKQRTIL